MSGLAPSGAGPFSCKAVKTGVSAVSLRISDKNTLFLMRNTIQNTAFITAKAASRLLINHK